MSPPGRKLPPSGKRESVAAVRLAPAELAVVTAALLPGEKLATGLRRLALASAGHPGAHLDVESIRVQLDAIRANLPGS